MDVNQAVDLLRSLQESIQTKLAGLGDRPRSVVRRAKDLAEREALRRLQMTASYDSALAAGKQTFAVELDRFRPLSFTHTSDDIDRGGLAEFAVRRAAKDV